MNDLRQSRQGDHTFLGDPHLKNHLQWFPENRSIEYEFYSQKKMPLLQLATDDRSGIPHWRRILVHLAMCEDLHALPHATSNFLFGNTHHVIYRRWRRKRAMNSEFGRTIVLDVRLDPRPNRILFAPL
jgi:hypothetical protein